MMELPISNTLKEYYKKHNASFTDSERATIFWNSSLPISEKLAALREILDMTADDVLKMQIRKRLDIEAETESLFMNCDNDYIHMVLLDDDTDADSVFVSVNAAIIYGKENCDVTFKISKAILEDKLESNTDGRILLGGEAEFKKDGTLLSCDCYDSREIEVTFVNGMEATSFEDAYVPVLNPFEYGDIVRVMGEPRPAIVVESRKHWDRILEQYDQDGRPKNYYLLDVLTVEFLCSDGEFSHDHPDILKLEKVDHWDDEDEWNLLQSVSYLMKGEGWIETVIEHYHANKFNKK